MVVSGLEFHGAESVGWAISDVLFVTHVKGAVISAISPGLKIAALGGTVWDMKGVHVSFLAESSAFGLGSDHHGGVNLLRVVVAVGGLVPGSPGGLGRSDKNGGGEFNFYLYFIIIKILASLCFKINNHNNY